MPPSFRFLGVVFPIFLAATCLHFNCRFWNIFLYQSIKCMYQIKSVWRITKDSELRPLLLQVFVVCADGDKLGKKKKIKLRKI